MKQKTLLFPFVFCVLMFSSFVAKHDDGKTYKTAIKVSCACKEHLYIKKLGFNPRVHSAQIHNNKQYDVFMNENNELLIFEIINTETIISTDTLKQINHEIFT